jgi:hypothetical protein
MPRRSSVYERFFTKVRRGDECWEWTGARAGGKYGVFWFRGRNQLAHRMSLYLSGIDVHPESVVCHRCDNPICVRASHLFVGTHADNSADMVEKDRSCRGVRNPIAKFTEAQVLQIRANAAAGQSHSDQARRHGVTMQAISLIVRRVNWRHL